MWPRLLRRGSWKLDSSVLACSGCGGAYTLIRRRHHCRSCGGIFCGKCSAFRIDLPARISKSKKSGKPKKKGRVCRCCFEQHGGVVRSLAKAGALPRGSVLNSTYLSVALATWNGEGGGEGGSGDNTPAVPVGAKCAECSYLAFRTGETVEVLSKTPLTEGQPEGWWFGRVLAEGERPGIAGLFPAQHVEVVSECRVKLRLVKMGDYDVLVV